MRTLVILILLIGGGLAGAWLGGETWLARKAQRMIAEDPRVEAGSVTPLREIGRIGLGLTGVEMETPEGPAELPSVELWAAATSPNEFHAALPAQMTLPLAGQPRAVTAEDAVLSLRVSPGSEMAISRMAAVSGPVTVDGRPLLSVQDAEAQLVAMGAAAPRAARAAYQLQWRWQDLTPSVLLPMPVPGAAQALSSEGTARVFLTAPLRQADGAAVPELVGLTSDGLTLALGGQSLRLAGTVTADEEGRAEGAAFVYTADPRALMELLGEFGLIPQATVALAGTALEQVAQAEVELPPGIPAPPEAARGEQRIPLIFREGRMFLGPIAIGDAPLFPAAT